MTDDTLQKLLLRAQQRVEVLEAMIEDRSREVFLANEKLQLAADFLRDVYRAMPSALIVLDTEGAIEEVNDAALGLLGYAREALIGSPGSVVFEWQAVSDIGGGPRLVRSEVTWRASDGATIPVLFSARRLESQGRPRGVVCVALDLRDRKKLEIELQQAQKLESVGRLAAGVAHEINTPIQFVNDSIHFVRDAMKDLAGLVDKYRALHRSVAAGAPDADAVAEVKRAEEEADLPYLLENVPPALERSLDGLGRVTAIVRSMKEFAHPDQKEMAPVDLNRALETTLTIARNEYKYVADVALDLGDLPMVTCHAGEVNQAILNIVVNAAHAIGDRVKGTNDRGRITVRTFRDGPFAVLSIADTGGGIPDGIRDRIFDPFFTTKEVGRGTGQGLAIARSVIREKHGGDLSFETETGKGTIFFIRLPIEARGAARVAA